MIYRHIHITCISVFTATVHSHVYVVDSEVVFPLSRTVREATSAVNRAIESTSKTELLRSLQSEEARFSDVRPENMQWYMEILSKAINDKAEHEVQCR